MTALLDLLRTADGEVLAASLVPGAGSTCVVLAHGFSGSSAKPAVRRIAAGLARHASVLAYDARGHGRSTGRVGAGLPGPGAPGMPVRPAGVRLGA